MSKITKEIYVKICWQLKTRTCTRCTMQMSYLYALDSSFKTFIYSLYLTSFGCCYCKENKLRSVLYAFVFLLKINFIITLSKFAAKPLACGSWFPSHFDNVMTQFIVNKRTGHIKTNVNLFTGTSGGFSLKYY